VQPGKSSLHGGAINDTKHMGKMGDFLGFKADGSWSTDSETVVHVATTASPGIFVPVIATG